MRPSRLLTIAIGLAAVVAVGRRAQSEVDLKAHVEAGERRLAAGDRAGALAAFRRAVDLAPADERGFEGLGRALLAQGDFPGALAAAESVLRWLDPERWPFDSYAAVLRNVGFLRYRVGDLEGAQEALATAHSAGGTDLETDLRLLLTALGRRDLRAADRLLPEVRGRYGRIEPVWRLEMARRLVTGGASPSLVVLEWMAMLRPPPSPGEGGGAVATALRGELAATSGDLEGAAAAWRRLSGTPLESWAALELGDLAVARDRARDALAHFEAAARDPDVPPALVHAGRGQALRAAGRLEEAAAEFARGTGANPLDPGNEVLYGLVRWEQGDLHAAETAFTNVLDFAPRHPEALYQLGDLYRARGDRDRARPFLQRYLEVWPEGRHAARVRRLLESR
jgi:tetratricopeptide (TPR) repeat protein